MTIAIPQAQPDGVRIGTAVGVIIGLGIIALAACSINPPPLQTIWAAPFLLIGMGIMGAFTGSSISNA